MRGSNNKYAENTLARTFPKAVHSHSASCGLEVKYRTHAGS